jgi:heat shock protein HslJ
MFSTAIIVMVVAVLLSACGTGAGATSTLVGTQWVLTGLEHNGVDQPLVSGTQLTIQFDNGTLGGNAGCNSFGGNYSVNGQTLTISELHQTLMGCDAPILEQEDRYTNALTKAQSFALQGTTLTITSVEGTLRFNRA